jgi:hypothetical protein
MGYKYVVKSYRWVNGTIQVVATHFDDELTALTHARAVNLAETIKVYIEDEVIFSEKSNPEDQNSYA